MQSLNLRLGSSSSLTYQQLDTNFKRIKAAIDALETSVAGSGLGTVTSVGLSLPNIFSISGSPVTTAGTLTATLASQTGNYVFAAPSSSDGTPSFRALTLSDLPTISIGKGGLGLTSIIPTDYLLASNGSGYEGRVISVGPGPLTITQGTGSILLGINLGSISLTDLGGVLPPTSGGTNQSAYTKGDTLYASATNTLSRLSIGTTGQVLTVDASGVPKWASPSASGVTSVNGQVGVLSLTTSTSGSDFTISSPSSGTIQFNIPTASASNRGLLSSTDWSNFNSKLNSINGLTNTAQTLSVGTSGTDFTITSTGSTHTFNLPSASASNRGLLTSADWTTFNSKMTGSGTNGTIPIFNGTNSITNSLFAYTSAFLTGNLTFSSGESGANIRSFGTVSGNITAGTSTINAGLFGSASGMGVQWTTGYGFSFLLGTTTVASFNTSGTIQFSRGFAVDGFTYYSTVGGASTSIANSSYGVVIGASTAASVTVALPSAPIDGQEVCIAAEANRTITVTSSKSIFGQNSGVSIPINVSGGSAGAASIFLKYVSSGNGGTGAWYITGL